MTKQDFWNWFYNSASIMWARFQVVFGCLILVITMTDMSQWLPKEWMPIWLVINGVVAEYLRRSGTRVSTVEIQSSGNSQMQGIMSQPVTYLQSPDPVPPGADVVVHQDSSGTEQTIKYSGSSVFGMVGISFGLLAAIFMILFLMGR